MPDRERLHRQERLRHALASLEAGSFADAARAVEPVYLAGRDDADAVLLLGLAVAGCAHPDLAADLLDEAAVRRPDAAHPATDLVRLLTRANQPEAIAEYFAAARLLAPNDVRLLAAAAAWRMDAGDNEAAWPLLVEAALLDPALPVVQIGLATVEAERGELEAASGRVRALIARGDGSPAAVGNLAAMLGVQARFGEALDLFAQATRAAPANAQLAVNHGITLLKAGQLNEGWAAFNRRLALPGHALLPPSRLLPVLDGRLDGRTVLVTHDSGFGDTLQFARYLPMLADRGAQVVLWVPEPLRRLLQGMRGVRRVVSDREAWPAYDWHCPIIRLAEVFGTTLDTIPADVPYLHADPGDRAHWAACLPACGAGMRRVGLVWAGSARTDRPRLAAVDRRRSIDPAALGPLSGVPGIQWVSLQMDRPPPFAMADPMGQVRDFADTAAIVSCLDAVVSVDTSVAHLAGAMDVPVLLLDRYDNCWRWLTGRTDSVWYPSLRIFRQARWGDWDAPVHAVAEALATGVTPATPPTDGRHSA